MLRWCQIVSHLHNNNYGTKSAFLRWTLSVHMRMRHASYAVKPNAREVHSKHPGSAVAVRPSAVLPASSNFVYIPMAGFGGLNSDHSLARVLLQPAKRTGWCNEDGEEQTGLGAEQLGLRSNLPPGLRSNSAHPSPVTDVMLGPSLKVHGLAGPLRDPVQSTPIVGTASLEIESVAPPATTLEKRVTTAVRAIQSLFGGSTARKLKMSTLISFLNELGPDLLLKLNASQSSELLCLFGSLSDDSETHEYHSGHQTRIQGPFRAEGYWEEAMKVSEKKEEMGHEFREVDNYWSMRAYLELAKDKNSISARKMAKVYYSRIGRQAHEPFVHIIYHETLLFCCSHPESSDAVNTLCDVIGSQSNPHEALVALLWKVILVNTNTLPLALRSRILDLFLHRLHRPKFPVHKSDCLSIQDLATALTAEFFPCYQSSTPPPAVSSWITTCAHKGIMEVISVNEGFSNLGLLARYQSQQLLPGLPNSEPKSHSLEWRVILSMGLLDASLVDRAVIRSRWIEIQRTVHLLWRLWRNSCDTPRPREVERAVMIAFIQTATKLGDELLLSSCTDYISMRQLCVASSGTQVDLAQVEQLLLALTDALRVSQSIIRDQLLAALRDLSLEPHQRIHYLSSIFRQMVANDVNCAHQLYLDCRFQGIQVPPELAIFLATSLVYKEKWDKVAQFLIDSEFSNSQLEQLLKTILCTFQATRQEFMDPAFAKVVGDLIWKLYSNASMPKQLKYPARFFFPIMIASHHARQVVQLLEALLPRNSFIFTPRYFARVMRTLTSFRQFGLAFKILKLASASSKASAHSICGLRRQAIHGLMRAGAINLARRIHSASSPPSLWTGSRLLCSRVRSSSAKLALMRLVTVLLAHPGHYPTTLSTVQLLVKYGRFGMAKHVILQSHTHLKPEGLTMVGNAFLHGQLFHRRFRDKGLVWCILHTKDILARQYSFKPDRATVNIVVKAMLSEDEHMSLQRIKSLFDHLIRHGYPASETWRTAHGVPFGTPIDRPIMNLSNIPKGMSFKRHVQPLYKMFIKAFFARKDPHAAQRVIGILKEEEVLSLERKETREQALRRGISRKKANMKRQHLGGSFVQ